jgi:hypothetical protein
MVIGVTAECCLIALQEGQLACLNTLFMQGVCSLRTVLLILLFYGAV